MTHKKNSKFIFFKWIILILVLFFIGFFIAKNNNRELKTVKRTQILLGTVIDIQVRDFDEQKAEDAVTRAFKEIKRIDDLFTTFDETSPVGEINHSTDSIIKVNPEIFNLIMLCDSVTKISEGCFDVSLDKLTKAWGFYTNNPHLPEKDSIQLALLKSGWNKVKVLDNNEIEKSAGVGLNFGAIAKGYSVDKAIDVIKSCGIKEALVNAGGEINVIGKNWIIGIQHPREQNELIAKIKLDNMAVATSGDYEQYFEKDGFRYHHILNPATGYPSRGLQSVTIVNRNDELADALATAVFVMGKEKGIELVEKLSGTEAMVIDNNGKIFYSTGFKKYLVN